jgi:hypothetical protein
MAPGSTPRLSSTLAVRIAQLGVSILFSSIYFYRSYAEEVVTLQNLAEFTGDKPFQFRVLIPSLVRLLHSFTGLSFEALYLSFTILSVWFVLILFEKLLQQEAVASARRWHWLILWPLFANYIVYQAYYPADMLAIAFFILSLLLLRSRRFLVYCLLFVLALFNRETIVLMIPATILFYWRVLKTDPHVRRPVFLLIVFQLLAFLCVRMLLEWLFRMNPGGAFENHIAENTEFLQHVLSMRPNYVALIFVAFGGLHVISILGWRFLSGDLKRLLLLFPISLIPFFIAGRIGEVRIYSELVPLFSLSGVIVLQHWLYRAGYKYSV